MILINFIIAQTILLGVVIFILKKIIFSDTASSVNRLNHERIATEKKQQELNKQKQQFEEDCKKRLIDIQKEMEKMKMQAMSETEKKSEEIIKKAKKQSEELVQKANLSKDLIQKRLEGENDRRAVDVSERILKKILSEKNRQDFDKVLAETFLEDLKKVDPKHIQEIEKLTIISRFELDKGIFDQIKQILTEKIGKEIPIETKTNDEVVGGLLLEFGTMVLDGTLALSIKENVRILKKELET